MGIRSCESWSQSYRSEHSSKQHPHCRLSFILEKVEGVPFSSYLGLPGNLRTHPDAARIDKDANHRLNTQPA
jgi:hypothetical protein